MAALTGVRPIALTLDARFPAARGPGGAAAAVLAALAASALPPVARWAVPIGGRWRKGAPVVPADAESLSLELADGTSGGVYHRRGEDEWSFTMDAFLPGGDDAIPRVAAACADAARSLLDAGAGRITLEWQGSGALCIPELPVAGMRTQVVSATEDEVRDAYDAPERFWESGWKAEKRGGGVLLTRAMGARDSAEFLRAILPQQWELARAAKPGRTVYGAPRLDAGEDEVFRAGAAVLDLVGYDAAHAEKRPLLDIGARVLAYDDAGMLVEIQE